MKYYSSCALIVCLTIWMTGCASMSDNTSVLNGMIYDFDNEPVASVQIGLENGQTFVSDIYGHFRIEDLKKTEPYVLSLAKKGYESQSVQIEYSDTTQILYVQMYSAEQLLAEAEKRLQEKDYTATGAFLERAARAGGSPVAIGYLQAIAAVFVQQYEKAVQILEQLIIEGYTEPYIALLLADIYQYNIGDRDTAKKYLQQFLDTSYDSTAAERLRNLS